MSKGKHSEAEMIGAAEHFWDHLNTERIRRGKKSTSQSGENGRDTPGFVFFFFSLAPRISRAYKQFVSSLSSGGLHESTGLRSAGKLSTPLLGCESRATWLNLNLLAKRCRKRKKRAFREGPLFIYKRRI